MLDGVEVLSQTMVEGFSPFAFLTSAVSIFFVIALIIAIIIACQDESVLPVIITVLLFAIFIVPFAILGYGFEVGKNPDKMHYKVTISDDVNFTEFYEKYEIIDQEGKIYEIVERDANENK